MQWLEHKVPPPLSMLVVGILMTGLSILIVGIPQFEPVRTGLACLVALAGVGVAGAGVMTFTRAKTTLNPINIDAASSLVTGGVFAFSRNPMYVGMVLVLTGWAVFLGSGWLIVGPVGFALFIDRFQIRPEERVLAAKFGHAYADYCKRVRRWT